MSIIAALDNANKVLSVSGTTTATLAGSQQIYLTIPNWPVCATLSSIAVVSSVDAPTSGTMSVEVLSDGALFRSEVAGDSSYDNSAYLTALTVGKTMAVSYPSYIEDAQGVGCLYIRLKASSAFVTGTTFTVKAYGTRNESYSLFSNDHVPFLFDKSWKVLQVTSTATTDVTQYALRNGDPYVQGDINHSQTFPALTSTTDYLYVGSQNPFTRFYVSLRAGAGIGSGIAVTSQYWNGSAWTSFTPIDNTSDGQGTSSSFSYSGVITLPTLSSWTPTQVSTDPYYVYLQQVASGTVVAPGMSWCPNRYWIRFKAASLASELDLVGIQPLTPFTTQAS